MSGCSFVSLELNNRGGYLDHKLDNYWIVADTKPMRVLRAYVLVGSVTRLAQTKYASERELIVKHVNSAVKVASDAYVCAYALQRDCIYFDERMVELEVSVLRLLVTVLSSQDDEELFEALGKEISDTFPLLKTVDSLKSFVDAVTTTGEVAVNAGKAIQAVLSVGQSVYFKGRRLGALYRDSVELNMITVMSSLDTMCALKVGHLKNSSPDVLWAADHFYGPADSLPQGACAAFNEGYGIWQRGAGDLSEWESFLSTRGVEYRKWIIPNEGVFVQASDLIWRSCEHLTSDADELSDCIGRRKVKDGGDEKECAIQFDKEPTKALTEAEKVEKEDPEKQKHTPFTDQCRLIVYAKTVELRLNRMRRGGADTRIYWLSLIQRPSPPA